MKEIAVVTGATKGIGRAITLAFAKEGKDLVVCARNQDDLTLLKEEVEKTFNVQCDTFSIDMSKKEEVVSFATSVKKISSQVAVLVNNTGVFIPGEVTKEEDGALEMMIETNLYSAYYLTRELIPGMISKKEGHVFNICSTASKMAYTNGGSYSISKFALYGMTKVLREEMKEHGVRVTAILPGATYTASWEGVTDLPEDRFMKAEDIGATVVAAYKLSKQAVIEEIELRPQLGDL